MIHGELHRLHLDLPGDGADKALRQTRACDSPDRSSKVTTMTLPASHQLASTGRINILDAQPTTEFPHTPVSVVNHCVVQRREELLSDPFHSVCNAT